MYSTRGVDDTENVERTSRSKQTRTDERERANDLDGE